MKRFDGWGAPCSSRTLETGAACEPLERRVLLSGNNNDPVLVLVEPLNFTTWPTTVNSTTVRPWLWENPSEYLWDLDLGDWNTTDGDGNGYPDDAYGWNFTGGGSPNIIRNDGVGDHGATIVDYVLSVLNAAGSHGDRVRIMFVIGGDGMRVDSQGDPFDPLQYVLDRKILDGLNIVAVGMALSNTSLNPSNRGGAQALADAGIMLIGGVSNTNANYDDILGNAADPVFGSFYSATPRFGVQEAALDNIMPITTDPAVQPFFGTAHGINSFYAGVASSSHQSFAGPAAAAMAAVAVQAYQDANNGQNPTIQQIKQAMMSGVSYISGLDNKTITHDYVDDERQDGGLLDLTKIISSIQSTPAITDVSMTPVTQNGQTVELNLNASTSPTNWTISWGDNSGTDQSGVQVLDGELSSAQHTFRRDIQPHYYYPTLYAMLGTGSNRQVYLPAPAAQVEVFIDTEMGLTSGKDEYTLSRDGDDLVVTLENSSGPFYQTFAPGELPNTILRLGEGGDTVTIDFTNGDPLAFTALTVRGTTGADNLVRVIGSSGSDTIQNLCFTTLNVNGRLVQVDSTLGVYIDGDGGDDVILSSTLRPTTIVGGDGDDTITVQASGLTDTLVMAGEGDDILTVSTGTFTRVRLTDSETFAQINIGSAGGVIMDDAGSLVLRTQSLSIASGGFLDLANNRMIIDYTGSSPLATIHALLDSGYNNGDWDGDGIRSSTAAAETNSGIGFAEAEDLFSSFPATFGGQEVDDTALLLRYTGYGDANLNGQVTLADFNRLAANYGESNRYWVHGDFDYNGNVNLGDFNRLAANFGLSNWMDDFDEAEGSFQNYTYEELYDLLMGGGGS